MEVRRVLFRLILRYKGGRGVVDKDGKLREEKSLSEVAVEDLKKEGVSDLVCMIKDEAAARGSAMYACMERRLTLGFKMAMYQPDEQSDTGGQNQDCGSIFREQATEACAALYSTLEYGIVDDKSPILVDAVAAKYRLAMVKLLMTAWHQEELRQSCAS